MKKLLVIIVLFCVSCGALVPESDAIDAMEKLGFENVYITGSNFVAPVFSGCGQDDSVAFDATGQRHGQTIKATVCCGAIFKGCTIRF